MVWWCVECGVWAVGDTEGGTRLEMDFVTLLFAVNTAVEFGAGLLVFLGVSIPHLTNAVTKSLCVPLSFPHPYTHPYTQTHTHTPTNPHTHTLIHPHTRIPTRIHMD